MEWVLQLADEFDDAAAGVRLWWLTAAPYVELLLVALFGVGMFCASLLLGAGAMAIAAAATLLSCAAAFSLRRRFEGYNRG